MTLLSDRRLQQRHDPLLTEPIIVSIGPQHPSLTAPVRLIVQADGELIERVTLEVGFMHRGIERLCQERPWVHCAGLLSRCEWLAGANGDYLLSAAVEELTGIEPPPRAQWLRMAVLEISRIASHLFWFGDLGLELGAITPIFWALEERELALDLLEMLSGQRYHGQYIVPGGVRYEPPEEFFPRLGQFIAAIPPALDRYEEMFSDNAIWVNRAELVGVLQPDFALRQGASGPVLRGSGVAHDLRRDAPYAAYAMLDVRVPVGECGDALDRYRVRFEEMRESVRLLGECLPRLAGTDAVQGVVRRSELPLAPGELRPPAGETYVAVEGPRGELGLSVVSDGGPCPARLHLRGPSLYHLHLLDELCRGHLLADVFVVYASLDIMVGEADR
jgi:NADH:ubiquinone oxidoreductase subunit D